MSQSIADSLSRFIAPTQVTELRALHVGQRGRTYAGFFDGAHLDELSRWALNLSRESAGVYFIPNSIDPALSQRSPNTVTEIRRDSPIRLTTDRDIIERNWLIIDFDPVRFPANESEKIGQNDPTTDTELGEARELARTVARYLRKFNWNEPVCMMSGNGIHLSYPFTKLLTEDDIFGVIPLYLSLISTRFSSEKCKIDTNTGNASRMLKVPGTMSRKGTTPLPGRPWRTVEIIHDLI